MQKRAGYNKLIVKAVGSALETLNETTRVAFLQELAITYRFRDHPNILRVYGYCTRPVALLLKLYEFGDVSKFIRKKGRVSELYPYSKINIFSMIRGIFSATAHMHNNGVVHCDIKPFNILIDTDEFCLLIEVFSSCRWLIDEGKCFPS